jgi:type II secretory pathway pseudopilin PulG
MQQQVQQQVQQVAAAIAVQQQQQAAAMQQQQMGCNVGGAGMTPPDAYGLAAMSCSPGAPGAVGSTSPLSAR